MYALLILSIHCATSISDVKAVDFSSLNKIISVFVYCRVYHVRYSTEQMFTQIIAVMLINYSFLARDSMLSALYAIARPSVRPSVRLSVCLSVCLSVRHTGGSVENG